MPSFRDPKTRVFKGAIMQADVVNHNGRMYSKECLEKAVEDFNKRKKEDKLHMVGDAMFASKLTIKGNELHACVEFQGNSGAGDS